MDGIACPSCGTEIPAAFKFCGACGHKLEDAPPAAPALELEPTPETTPASAVAEARDERREVSVMFADVSGFTAMSERLDPEAVHQIMNDCFDGLGRAIQDEDGHIDKYIGDNIMALFGAPVAHEDDPARAARAALAMQAFLRGFAESHREEAGVEFKMRIGIHCGLVLAGGVGSFVRRDYSVMGDAVNLAARLESSAEPGTVLVSHRIMRRTRGQFEFGPARHLKVKGKVEEVEAYELVREVAEQEHGARDPLAVTLVGREGPLAELIEGWDSAGGGAGWVEVRGPMGSGKTRLIEEAAARAPGTRLLRVVARAPTQRRPFALARRVVHAVAQEVAGRRVKAETREDFTAALTPLAERLAPFLSALWYLAAPDRIAVPAPDPDPQTLRRTLERGLAILLDNLAGRVPGLVLFLDSYELGDDASATLFESLAAQATGPPMPIVAAARDEGREAHRPETVISIGPLNDDAAAELLDRLVHGGTLPDGLRRDLLNRAAGVPLFIEEMVRKLVDEGVLRPGAEGAAWACDPEATSAILPGSIMGAMVSRLDRLDRPARDLLCQCAIQGVEFYANVAERVWLARAEAGEPISARLADLEARQLVVRVGDKGVRWTFRQQLMQDACYQTLLLRNRKVMHADTAEALCETAGGVEAVSPEILAHHYDQAEMWADSGGANLRAGNRAAELYLNDDATRRYDNAIAAVRRLEDWPRGVSRTAAMAHGGAARIHLRVGAYTSAEEHGSTMLELGVDPAHRAEADRLVAASWLHTGRAEEAERRLLEALASARGTEAEGAEVAIAVLYDLSELCHRAGRTLEALERLGQCRAVKSSYDPATAVRLDLLEGGVAHTEGRFADAAELYARAYVTAEELGSLSEQARSSNDMGTTARDVGEYDNAHRYFRRALETWERTGDTECIAGAHNNLANLAMSRGQLDLARTHHQYSLSACREIGNVRGSALACTNLAILAIEDDNGREAIERAEEAMETLKGTGNAVLRGLTLVVLGEAYLEETRHEVAQAAFERVLEEFDEESHPLAIAGAHRGLGRVALALGVFDEALERLRSGLDGFERLERAQEAARTRLYRAEAWHGAGQADSARADLEEARERFAEMGADRDAARAEALMARFREAPRS